MLTHSLYCWVASIGCGLGELLGDVGLHLLLVSFYALEELELGLRADEVVLGVLRLVVGVA